MLWKESAKEHYRKDHIARIPVEKVWNLKGITWTAISSSTLSFRLKSEDEIANNAALFIYPKDHRNLYLVLACLNACQTQIFLKVISRTLNFLVGDILSLPIPKEIENHKIINNLCEKLIELEKDDWDSQESS